MRRVWCSLLLSVLLLATTAARVLPATALEVELTGFIKQFYDNQDIQIAFTQFPSYIKETSKARTMTFTKVPDANGDGICLVGLIGRNGSEMNVYVPFKVFVKRKLYVVKHSIRKGNPVHVNDMIEKETFLNGPLNLYPATAEDIVGKQAKKEMNAGEIITNQLLEDRTAVQKGGIINVSIENTRLLVQAKGIALERGKVGDLVKVKSASGKEISGRVIGNNTVKVEF